MIYLLSPSVYEGVRSLPVIRFIIQEQRLIFEGYDMLMFTSKQAVISAETLNQTWKQTPCIAIGAATAKQIEDLGGTVVHQANDFYGKRVGEDIIRYFKEKKILYLRPKEVSFDSKNFLKNAGIFLDEQIIYQTVCMEYTAEQRPLKDAMIIFTSPSTIRCFFKNFTWDESYTAIVIGEETKKHLPSNIRCEIAQRPLIVSCIEKAKELEQSR